MEDLVRQAQAGDSDAFVTPVERCRGDLYRAARGFFQSEEDIADALQATILSCSEHLGGLRRPRYFKTWMTRVLIRKCTDLMREGRRYAPEEPPEQGAPDPGQENAEFHALLGSLDEPYRLVLLLYYGEGYNVREVASLLGLSVEAVKSRLRRGREQAKRAYETE